MTHHSRMNSIFIEQRSENGDIFHATCMAHQPLKIRYIFAKPIECEALFNKPRVRDERRVDGVVSKPKTINDMEINTESLFDLIGMNLRMNVLFLEGFSESV